MATKVRGKEGVNKEEAYRLRTMGYSYEEIGKMLNITHQTAYGLVRSAWADATDERRGEIEMQKDLDLSVLNSISPSAVALAKEGDLKAIDVVLKILGRRSKYLGLDVPAKQEVKTQQAVIFGEGYEVL